MIYFLLVPFLLFVVFISSLIIGLTISYSITDDEVTRGGFAILIATISTLAILGIMI